MIGQSLGTSASVVIGYLRTLFIQGARVILLRPANWASIALDRGLGRCEAAASQCFGNRARQQAGAHRVDDLGPKAQLRNARRVHIQHGGVCGTPPLSLEWRAPHSVPRPFSEAITKFLSRIMSCQAETRAAVQAPFTNRQQLGVCAASRSRPGRFGDPSAAIQIKRQQHTAISAP